MANNDIEVGSRGSLPRKDYFEPLPAPMIDMEELAKWSFYRAIIAEFVATLLFLYVTVLTVIGNKTQTDPLNGGNLCGGVGTLGIAWVFGGMIFVLVYCTAGISGNSLLFIFPQFSKPRKLTGWVCRRTHKPGGDIRNVSGEKDIVDSRLALHYSSVLGGVMRLRLSQVTTERSLQPLWRCRQPARRRLQQRHRSRRRDRRHLRPSLHRLLRH